MNLENVGDDFLNLTPYVLFHVLDNPKLVVGTCKAWWHLCSLICKALRIRCLRPCVNGFTTILRSERSILSLRLVSVTHVHREGISVRCWMPYGFLISLRTTFLMLSNRRPKTIIQSRSLSLLFSYWLSVIDWVWYFSSWTLMNVGFTQIGSLCHRSVSVQPIEWKSSYAAQWTSSQRPNLFW